MGKKKKNKKKRNKKKKDITVVATADEHVAAAEGSDDHPVKLKNKAYLKEVEKLQLELVRLQEWVTKEGLRLVIVLEGRDAAGKGGVL